jgi:RND family efflux transporter MFP subunit
MKIDWGDVCRLLLVVLLLATAGCGGESSSADENGEGDQTEAAADDGSGDAKPAADDEGEDEEDDEAKRPERATSVTVAPVTRGELVIPILAEGAIRARNATEIKFELAGRIERILVKEGDRVRKGQTLAVLDDREYEMALEEARTRYLQALGQLAVEEKDLTSHGEHRSLNEQIQELNELERAGKITRQERLDREMALGVNAVKDGSYRRELLEVRSGLSSARADETRAEYNLEKCELKAPFAGVVADLDLSAGQRISVGDRLCRVVDDVNVEAEVGVLEADLGVLEVGRPALLYVPALGDDFVLPLQVDVISPDIDETSRTCRVLLRLTAENGKVKPGMFVRASIAGHILSDRLLVPREAILTRDARPLLFKVQEDRSRWVYVKLGAQNDQMVEIDRVLQGGPLEPGTMVIVDNHLTLTHDAKIKVTKTEEILDPWAAYAQGD